MNDVAKHLILYMSKLEGFISCENLFLGMNMAKELREVSNAIAKASQKLGKVVNHKEVEKLVNDIQTDKVSVEIVHDFEKIMNKKKMSKLRVKMDWGIINDLAESAIWKVCDDCNYKNKNCKLRRTFKKLNEYNIYAPCQYEQFETKRVDFI